MNVRNCRKCGKIFNYIVGAVICPSCKEALEEKFKEVKQYILDNKHADVSLVAEECNVEIAQIHQWIREERLMFADDSPISIPCESCGAPIKSGKYCDKCKIELHRSLTSVQQKRSFQSEKLEDSAKGPRMRVR